MTRLARYAADALILLGAALAVGGIWWIYPPAALVVGGLMLIALAILGGTHGSAK